MKNHGFSIIETMIVVAMLGLIIVLAVGAWGSIASQKRIQSTMENLYDTLKLAHSESIKRRTVITVSFRFYAGTSPSWCYGLSDVGDCDCRVANACTIEGVQRVIDDASSPTTMAITNLSGPANGKFVQFEGIRGTVSNSGSIQFSSTGYSGVVNVNALGFVRNCSNNMTGFNGC